MINDRNKIKKRDIINRIAKETGVSNVQVKKICDMFIAIIKDELCKGREVSISGFGSFFIRRHKGHPVQFGAKDGEIKDYPVVRFTASKVFAAYIKKIL